MRNRDFSYLLLLEINHSCLPGLSLIFLNFYLDHLYPHVGVADFDHSEIKVRFFFLSVLQINVHDSF